MLILFSPLQYSITTLYYNTLYNTLYYNTLYYNTLYNTLLVTVSPCQSPTVMIAALLHNSIFYYTCICT